MEIPNNLSAVRACGQRVPGGVYAETRLGEEGLPLEHYLLCPPKPIDLDAWGLTPVGVQLISFQGHNHVFDVVGRRYYPYVTDFVEEIRRKGASRRLTRNFEFAKLTEGSLMVLIHARAVIQNYPLYPQPPGVICPRGRHLGELDETCAGLWWHDIPTKALERWSGGGLYHRSLPGCGSYNAFPRPANIQPVYQHGIFMSLPITNLAVITGRNQLESEQATQARQAAEASGLPVVLERE